MLERDIRKYLVAKCKTLGIMIEKFTSPSGRSKPDEILTYKGGRIVFIELKATGKIPSAAQTRDHIRRMELGADVVWTDSEAGVDRILTAIVEYKLLLKYYY